MYIMIDQNQKGASPLRKKIEIKQTFSFIEFSDHAIVTDHQKKYNLISDTLDKNSEILDLVHADLSLLGTGTGRESSFTSEQLLRMIIVRTIEQFNFRDLIIRISDSSFLRSFTRIGCGPVMGFTLVNTAEKHIQQNTWNRINDLLMLYVISEKKLTDGSALRLDSTVTHTNIHYPTDCSLLWDCYRVLSRIMKELRNINPKSFKNRFNTNKIKTLYTFISMHISKKNKSVKRKVHKAMKTLLERVGNLCVISKSITVLLKNSGDCSSQTEALLLKLAKKTALAEKILDQVDKVYFKNLTIPGADKIYSIFEPHTELLIRGKAQNPFEFGHLIQIGQTHNKFISYYKVEERSQHDTVYKDDALESHKELFGKYPAAFTADKNYYESMDDIDEWEEKIDIMAIGKKGTRTKDEKVREHSEMFKAMQQFRAGCEGSISVLKRAFGLGKCFLRSFKSFASNIGKIVFCHNVVLLAKLT